MSTQYTFPKTLQEAILYYSDPLNTLATAIRFRWPDGVTCPHCGSQEHSFISTRTIWKCKGCKKQFSAKVGTIFEDSPLGLDKWFIAMWLVVNCKNGVSSYELHRAIGVTQKTAWFMLHRLRKALNPEEEERMSGEVEIDETYIGGKAKNMHKDKKANKITSGRGAIGKSAVMGLLERHGEKGKSQVKAKVVTTLKQSAMQDEVKAHVEEGSILYTDEFASYKGLGDDYIHEVINHAECYAIGVVHTNGLENFWSLLKRCIRGTYVSCDAAHLTAYIDEQAFRFNNRKGNDQDRFCEALAGIDGKRLTWDELTTRAPQTAPRRGG